MKNYTTPEIVEIFSELFQKLNEISEKNEKTMEWHRDIQFKIGLNEKHQLDFIWKSDKFCEKHDEFIEKLQQKNNILKEYYSELEEVFYIVICNSSSKTALIKQINLFDKAINSADQAELYYDGDYHKVALLYNFPYEHPLWAVYLAPQKVFR